MLILYLEVVVNLSNEGLHVQRVWKHLERETE